MTAPTTQTTNQTYFNLTTNDATGYFNRVRVVEGKGKQPSYLAADFCAYKGGPGYVNADTERFVCTIKGKQANDVIQDLLDAGLTKADKLYGRVCIADLGADFYLNKENKPVAFIKGRIIKVFYVTKNGTRVFDIEPTDDVSSAPENDLPEAEVPSIDDTYDNARFESDADLHAEARA